MSHFETADGLSLYAEAHGEGPPIVFSCAFSTSHENWRPQVEPLVQAGHRVILWDYRGHGLSNAPHDPAAYTMDKVVDDLGRLLEWGAGGQPAVLAGLSFGGLASLHYSARQLASVRGLVLVATGPGFKNAEAAAKWQARADRSAGFIETKGFEAFVHGKAGPTCIGRDPELPAARAAGQAIIAQDSVAVGLFGRNITGPAPSVIDELAGIEVPALVVVGEDDPGFHQAAEVMAAKLPQARSVRVEGGGHILNIEVADDFNAMLVDFLSAL
ncbi:MAG: alpha/beta hydrolase [Myxococcota bacterium]|jgi:pimeloyl-ACP methyl ester carboxylesterase